jgi:prepilin-type N-terminal cleavage/methylation domain-containing protein
MTKPQNKQVFGFTLIEVLISLFILALILVGAGQLLSNSSTITRTINAQTSVQEELRAAAAIMNDEIQRAYYVFPPQSSVIKTSVAGSDVPVNWSQFNLGTSNLKTGIHESTIFTVNTGGSGSNPQILAMITAPRNPNEPCLKVKTVSTDVNDKGCYQFVAYYGVLRPKVTRGLVGNSTTSSELLNQDSSNSGRMVLMEFRMSLTGLIAGSPSTDWGEVGCQFRAISPFTGTACTTSATTADPYPVAQGLTNSIPALSCYAYCNTSVLTSLPLLADAQRFATRMKNTVDWINLKAPNVPATILVDNIDESQGSGNQGFFISMPLETYDARGVFQVRLRLKGKITDNGTTSTFPSDPISVYASPRNIAPLL